MIALSLLSPPPQTRENWRNVADYIARYARSGDFVLVNHRNAKRAVDTYFHRGDVRVKGFLDSAITLGLPLENEAHVWLVLYTPNIEPGYIIERGHWQVVSQKTFKEITVIELANGVTDERDALPHEQRFSAVRAPPRGPR